MLFTVLPTGQLSQISLQPNSGYLIEDQWNDWFKYRTMYDLYIIDSSSERIYIGKVKIGQYAMDEKQQRPDLPSHFTTLDSQFFSLGQDSYYYENIKNLGDSYREAILKALNDIAFNTSLINTVKKENVTKESLLRSVPIDIIKGQFHRIALGGARLTPYNFEYQTNPTRNDIQPVTLTFNVNPDSCPPSNIHVIIGRNGVGKTHLINNMIQSIIQPKTSKNNHGGETRFLHDNQPAVEHFSRIIFVSFSAFDDLSFKSRSKKFIRIGLPTRFNKTNILSQSNALLKTDSFLESETLSETNTHDILNNTFATSFSSCLYGPQKSLLIKILNMLKSDPMFAEAEIVNFCDNDVSFNNDTLIHIFSRLSSGHKIILLSLVQLIEQVMEKTLVFLDEPEGHLHPPLLSTFIRALSELLLDKNGVAIIATHSPVILQEVPRNCVWKLRRNGAHCNAERLEIESFGTDLTTLTTEIFGLEVTNSGYHKLLSDLANKYSSYEIVMTKLNGQLGAEGKALLKSMFMLKNEEN